MSSDSTVSGSHVVENVDVVRLDGSLFGDNDFLDNRLGGSVVVGSLLAEGSLVVSTISAGTLTGIGLLLSNDAGIAAVDAITVFLLLDVVLDNVGAFVGSVSLGSSIVVGATAVSVVHVSTTDHAFSATTTVVGGASSVATSSSSVLGGISVLVDDTDALDGTVWLLIGDINSSVAVEGTLLGLSSSSMLVAGTSGVSVAVTVGDTLANVLGLVDSCGSNTV